MKTVTLFLFHRDLRIHDNMAYNQMMHSIKPHTNVIFLFCYNPVQIDPKKNRYFNRFAIQFMCDSLDDLNIELKQSLNILYGQEDLVIAIIIKKYKIDKIYQNQDITPFAIARTFVLEKLCKNNKIELISIQGD